MKRVAMYLMVLGLLNPVAGALEMLQPGYTVETYATYSNAGRATAMTFDDSGNLYSAQAGSIWRVAPGGAASEWVSNFEGPASIEWAGGTVFGDYLFVVRYETWDGSVHRIGLDGSSSLFGTMPSGGHAAYALGLDRTGNYEGYMYVGTTGQDHTYRVNFTGNIAKWAEWPYWTDGGGPCDIEFDTTGNYGGEMYVATWFVSTPSRSGVFALDTDGTASRLSGLASARQLAFDDYGLFDGELFAIGAGAIDDPYTLWRIAPDGLATEITTSEADLWQGLCFGPDGALYVAEHDQLVDSVTISRITPEPATVLLLGLGAVMMGRKR